LASWHLARGRRVAFLDADGQASSSRWMRSAEPSIVVTEAFDGPAILNHVGALHEQADVIVADGPANLAEATRALLLIADLAIIPCGPTVPELESTAQTVRILETARCVRANGAPAALLVLNRLRNDRYALTKEAPVAVSALGVSLCRSVLRLRETTADAPGQRTVVWRMGYRARTAASEMLNLMEEIEGYAAATTNHPRNLIRRAGDVLAAGVG
jgi:chromosome partitioning protein